MKSQKTKIKSFHKFKRCFCHRPLTIEGDIVNNKIIMRATALAIALVIPVLSLAGNSGAGSLFGLDYDINASSALIDGKMSYPASNLIPPSMSRSWCEGAEGDGIGEWVELDLKHPVRGGVILAILPGYSASRQTYINNGRPKTVEILLNGHIKQEVEIKDISREQQFNMNAPSSETLHRIRLTIKSVRPGLKYHDTCLSEVLLLPESLNGEDGEREAEREASRVEMLFGQARAGKLDAMEELVRMSTGPYYRSAEGGEWLDEIYLELFAEDSYRFLFVALKQHDRASRKILDAIASPVNDKYSYTQLLGFLDKGVKAGIDADPIKPLRDALRQHARDMKE